MDKKGFSLTQVLFASFIVLIAVVALLLTYTFARQQMELGREMSLVNNDARDALERVFSVPFTDLTTVFPNNGSISESIVGGFQLRDEDITISYPAGVNANPLVIDLTVSWTSFKNAARSEQFRVVRSQYL